MFSEYVKLCEEINELIKENNKFKVIEDSIFSISLLVIGFVAGFLVAL